MVRFCRVALCGLRDDIYDWTLFLCLYDHHNREARRLGVSENDTDGEGVARGKTQQLCNTYLPVSTTLEHLGHKKGFSFLLFSSLLLEVDTSLFFFFNAHAFQANRPGVTDGLGRDDGGGYTQGLRCMSTTTTAWWEGGRTGGRRLFIYHMVFFSVLYGLSFLF